MARAACNNCGREVDGFSKCDCGALPCFDCGGYSILAQPIEGRQGNYACDKHTKEREQEAKERKELLGGR